MKLKLSNEYREEFYAYYLYNKIEKEDTKAQFVMETKEFIEKGKFVDAIHNLKILFYEKGLRKRVDNYYDTPIIKNKINREFLINQKLLLDNYFGEFNSYITNKFFDALSNIAISFAIGVFIILWTKVLTNDGMKEAITQYKYNIIVGNMGENSAQYFKALVGNNECYINICWVILIMSILGVIFFTIGKTFKSYRKDVFYKLCLKAVQQLLDESGN